LPVTPIGCDQEVTTNDAEEQTSDSNETNGDGDDSRLVGKISGTISQQEIDKQRNENDRLETGIIQNYQAQHSTNSANVGVLQ
jgi:hypothetical protein